MAIQIIKRPEPREGAGDAFAKAIMGFLSMRENQKKQQLEKSQFAEESKALQDRFGQLFQDEQDQPFDFSKIQDPVIRRTFAQKGLESEAELSKIRNIKKEFPEFFSEEIQKEPTPELPTTPDITDTTKTPPPRETSTSKPPYKQKDIMKMAAIGEHSMAREMRAANDEWSAEQQTQEKVSAKKLDISTKERREDHKASEKYDEALRESSIMAKKQIMALKDIDKALKSNQVKPSNFANIVQHVPKYGKAISDAFLSGNQAAINANIPYLLEGWKDIFGVRLSDADLRVLQDKLPSIAKSPEANKAIVNIMKKYAHMAQLKHQIASNLKKENDNFRIRGFEDEVERRFDEQTSEVTIKDKNTGMTQSIPRFYLESALKNKNFELVNE